MGWPELSNDTGLAQILELLRHRRILCFGDVMLDVEVDCSSGRISPEAPVLAFAERATRYRPGGAANVAVNVAALGAASCLGGSVGNDTEGGVLADLLCRHGVRYHFPDQATTDRPTTRKTRFTADGQLLLRIDRETTEPLPEEIGDALLSAIEGEASPLHAILISDYGKGVVTGSIMQRLHRLARYHHAPLLVDPKGLNWSRYGPVDLIKPNASELAAFTGLVCNSDAEVERALVRALELCEANTILVTRAGSGSSILRRDGIGVDHHHVRTIEVIDVCGAGDTNFAMLGAMLAVGCPLSKANDLAQLASSLAVQHHGNAIIYASDLLSGAVAKTAPSAATRVMARETLLAQIFEWRRTGLRIGFTNGCFDLVHPGHIRSLEMARSQCDRLVVGINSDTSVRHLKGATRPILGEQDRALVLASFVPVDAVVIFNEDTPQALIEDVRPDVLCKGGDYESDKIAGGDFVRSYGGSVLVSELMVGVSTSAIIDIIRDRLHDQTPI